jgi:hypothetical protein
LASTIKQEYGESESFKNRQTFILFCRASVGQLCRAQFEQLFYPSYIKLAQDKIATVRKQFALSILDIKPYLDSNPKLMSELFDASVRLKKDKCLDVREAMDKTDFDEMKQHKKVLLIMDEREARNKERQKRLDRRELLDIEEKKRRQDDEQEFEYFSRKPTNKAKLMSKQSTIKPTVKRVSSTQNTDKKVDNKRKIISGSSKRNSSALPDLVVLQDSQKKKLTTEQSLSYKQVTKDTMNLTAENYQKVSPPTVQSAINKRSSSLMSDSKQKLQRKLPEIASVVQYNYNFRSAKKGD